LSSRDSDTFARRPRYRAKVTDRARDWPDTFPARGGWCQDAPAVSREDELAAQIEKAESELAALGQAREQTLVRLAALRAAGSTTGAPPQLRLPIVNGAPAPRTGAEKIRLFRSLFRGRTDGLPKRWENAKQERSGYAPACANEWVRTVCEKPKVRCGECPDHAFLEVEDRVIADHLGGKYTAGVYPLLRDDTCWFVALDFDEALCWQCCSARVPAPRQTVRRRAPPRAVSA
jgi:hypothetical protein